MVGLGGHGGFDKGQGQGALEHEVFLGELLRGLQRTTGENRAPHFTAPAHLQNKEHVGKVEEIFGNLEILIFQLHCQKTRTQCPLKNYC